MCVCDSCVCVCEEVCVTDVSVKGVCVTSIWVCDRCVHV